MNKVEGLYATAVSKLNPEETKLITGEGLSSSELEFHFAMSCNGQFMTEDGKWQFYAPVLGPFVEEFTGQRTSFFGPGAYYGVHTEKFYSNQPVSRTLLVQALNQPEVTEVIGKYRQYDIDQAARIAFILGGIVRHIASHTPQPERNPEEMAKAVKLVAKLTSLGEQKSGDAIASAMAMYVISEGQLNPSRRFAGDVYYMAEAVNLDPIIPSDTIDLGLSQVARLRAFKQISNSVDPKPLQAVIRRLPAFNGFPTVGAEFHFPPDAPEVHPNFWQRLALLNMSQYQRGSYIQLSRNDRDVIEVRMNPSIYPVTVANWNHMRQLLPELDKTFYTLTINRRVDADFHWSNEGDKPLLNQLRAVGMLSYATLFDTIPYQAKEEEINFGSIYLGQTVKMQSGEYQFSGNWGGGAEGEYGQMGIYAGFGENLPYLAYYLTMALAKPSIVEPIKDALTGVTTLSDALDLNPVARKEVFGTIQRGVFRDGRLFTAYRTGNRITELLNPNNG